MSLIEFDLFHHDDTQVMEKGQRERAKHFPNNKRELQQKKRLQYFPVDTIDRGRQGVCLWRIQ